MSSVPDPPRVLRVLSWPLLSLAEQTALAKTTVMRFEFIKSEDGDDALRRLAQDESDIAVLAVGLVQDPAGLQRISARVAVVLRADANVEPASAIAARWLAVLERGVQDVLVPADWASAGLGLRLCAAAVRHRLGRESRIAYATDLATGLPHQQQLLEHMSHLLALREREPAPMALLVLRVEGLATTAARLGPDAAGALRRKLAVRLRSGLRASDVVASIGSDSFAVLLAWIDAAADVQGVADKLVRSVQRPFSLAGQSVALAVCVGSRRYPEDGKDADALLQGAVAEAAGLPGQGRSGHVNHLERGAAPAANDD